MGTHVARYKARHAGLHRDTMSAPPAGHVRPCHPAKADPFPLTATPLAPAAALARADEHPYARAMDNQKTTLERAFEQAKTGRFNSVGELKKALSKEGFNGSQVEGTALIRQLRDLISAARRPSPPDEAA